jgi:hypothetical protein
MVGIEASGSMAGLTKEFAVRRTQAILSFPNY